MTKPAATSPTPPRPRAPARASSPTDDARDTTALRMVPTDVLSAIADEAEGITCRDEYPNAVYFVCTREWGHEGDHEDRIRDMPNTVAWSR